MFKCLNCGAIFETPLPLKESHGEMLDHCPHCHSDDFCDEDQVRCWACHGMTEHSNEKWCEECKETVRREVMGAVCKASWSRNLNTLIVYEKFLDVLNDEEIFLIKDEARTLMDAVIEIADERGCGIATAQDMVYDFVKESWRRERRNDYGNSSNDIRSFGLGQKRLNEKLQRL